MSETRASLSGEIDALDVKREATVAEITHNNKEIEAQRAEQSAAADALNNAQETYYAVGGEVTRVEQALRFAQERRGELQRHLDQTRSNLEQTQNIWMWIGFVWVIGRASSSASSLRWRSLKRFPRKRIQALQRLRQPDKPGPRRGSEDRAGAEPNR